MIMKGNTDMTMMETSTKYSPRQNQSRNLAKIINREANLFAGITTIVHLGNLCPKEIVRIMGRDNSNDRRNPVRILIVESVEFMAIVLLIANYTAKIS